VERIPALLLAFKKYIMMYNEIMGIHVRLKPFCVGWSQTTPVDAIVKENFEKIRKLVTYEKTSICCGWKRPGSPMRKFLSQAPNITDLTLRFTEHFHETTGIYSQMYTFLSYF